nr:MAG TPA: protein of unknown function (DUF4713) [Caudoviricetes sp.]
MATITMLQPQIIPCQFMAAVILLICARACFIGTVLVLLVKQIETLVLVWLVVFKR